MTNREYELLKFLMQNRGIAYSRDDLLSPVFGDMNILVKALNER